MSDQLYQITDCTNCRCDAWQLGAFIPVGGGRVAHQEYKCFYCGAVVDAPPPVEDR